VVGKNRTGRGSSIGSAFDKSTAGARAVIARALEDMRGTTMLPMAVDEDLLPPLKETRVSVNRLVSSEAISKMSLLLALGTLMFA
jgi:hypothetical protein